MRHYLAPLALLACLCPPAHAAGHEHPERWYQERWCSTRGEMEVVMPDKTRADCANATHVVEFDFGVKWGESIGQSLNYGVQAGKRPGIVLILEKPSHMRYLRRVLRVRAEYNLPLDIWAVDKDGQELPLPRVRR
ncbi:MAG: hypothetical protein KKF77_09370 [Proteobacteria bacterium]|nr:hypothetical protein [Pseudomonadota bacterium]